MLNPGFRQILKYCFWDYREGALHLPEEMFVQRVVDCWEVIEDAYRRNEIDNEVMADLLKLIARHRDRIRYSSSFKREFLSKLLNNISSCP